MMGLTPRQRELLNFLRAHVKAHGIAPTYEEIRLALCFSNKGHVSETLRILAERGYVVRPGNSGGRIKLLKSEDEHARNCLCDGCIPGRTIAYRKLIEGLQIPPPVAVLFARRENIKPLSDAARAGHLGSLMARTSQAQHEAAASRPQPGNGNLGNLLGGGR